MSDINSKLSALGFNSDDSQKLTTYLQKLYDSNRNYYNQFYEALSKNDSGKILELSETAPDEIKQMIDKKVDAFSILYDKIGEILSLFSATIKKAFTHLAELADKEPEKAKYIIGIGVVSIILAYLLGKRSNR